MNPGTARDRVSEGRSGLAISAIRSAVEPADRRVPATGAVELSNELLRMISDVLDVRDVFPRIAQTASRMLQHDCLDLVVSIRQCDVADAIGRGVPRGPAGVGRGTGRVLPRSRSPRGRVTGWGMGAAHVC